MKRRLFSENIICAKCYFLTEEQILKKIMDLKSTCTTLKKEFSRLKHGYNFYISIQSYDDEQLLRYVYIWFENKDIAALLCQKCDDHIPYLETSIPIDLKQRRDLHTLISEKPPSIGDDILYFTLGDEGCLKYMSDPDFKVEDQNPTEVYLDFSYYFIVIPTLFSNAVIINSIPHFITIHDISMRFSRFSTSDNLNYPILKLYHSNGNKNCRIIFDSKTHDAVFFSKVYKTITFLNSIGSKFVCTTSLDYYLRPDDNHFPSLSIT